MSINPCLIVFVWDAITHEGKLKYMLFIDVGLPLESYCGFPRGQKSFGIKVGEKMGNF